MKKFLTLLLTALLAVTCCFGLVGCGEDDTPVAGLICLHGESSTYDKNFIDAFKTACENKGVKYVIVTDIPESEKCYTEAVDLADSGCKVIFADSFGHEPHIIKAAKEYPDVQFCHATGTQAKQEKLPNFHDAFASIYEGRFLAGYAAGLKLNTMKDKAVDKVFKVGYVGAWTYAEVISGFTSWYLGVQEALDEGYSVQMEVQFTGSWYDETGEKEAAQTLINRGCVLISQHADSMGAPNACETASVPNVAYNGNTKKSTLVAYSRINWVTYFEYMLDNYATGTIKTDFCGTMQDNSVQYTICSNKAEGTDAKVSAMETKIKNGEIKIFDCSKFTVNTAAATNANITKDADGHLTAYKADIDGDYKGDTDVIKTVNEVTFFDESNADDFRSAPYFDIQIDGITYLNAVYDTDKETGKPIFIDFTQD